MDFIVRKSRPSSQTEIGRRREVQVEGLTLFVATIEDVAALMRVRRGELDLTYLSQWVEALAIRAQWERALRLAGPGAEGEA